MGDRGAPQILNEFASLSSRVRVSIYYFIVTKNTVIVVAILVHKVRAGFYGLRLSNLIRVYCRYGMESTRSYISGILELVLRVFGSLLCVKIH